MTLVMVMTEVTWMKVMRGLGGGRRGAKNLKEKNEEKEK